MSNEKEYVTLEFVKNLIEDPGMMGPAIVELAKKYLTYYGAHKTWQDKTEWVQERASFPFPQWGLHRADVMTQYIQQLEADVEALQGRLAQPVLLNRSAVMSSTYVIARIRAAGFNAAPESPVCQDGLDDELENEAIELRAKIAAIRNIVGEKQT